MVDRKGIPYIKLLKLFNHKKGANRMLSFSLDFTDVFSMASTMINGLFPVYLVPLGISLGIGILGIIVRAFSRIIR